jgi:predicted RNA binding protein YcfA (HicA-like mRNA interferase family)
MAARDKTLENMRRNPRGDWRIEDIKGVARKHGIQWRSPGGSHVIFVAPDGSVLSVPARRPIKPVYVRLFVEMVDRVRSKTA